jgi:hypothetical protein
LGNDDARVQTETIGCELMGHIVEVNEHVDWNVFYTHGIPEGIPDEEWRKIIGNRAWDILHGAVDHFPCETCRDGGQVLMSGIHDMVNLTTDKGIHDFERWKRFLAMVDEARKHNPHSPHYRHERVADPEEFDAHSFRTVKEGKHLVVVGCPVGHYSGGSCAVGTRPQAILHPVGHGR